MKPIDQTRLHDEQTEGNCFEACLASILEMSIEDVPDFGGLAEGQWWFDLEAFLKPLNLKQVYFPTGSGYCFDGECFHIRAGKSPRGDFKHAVVGWGADTVHDPHPSKAGIEDESGIYIFVSIDPSELVKESHHGS